MQRLWYNLIMFSRSCSRLAGLLIFILLASCLTSPEPSTVSVGLGSASPTPFQPGRSDPLPVPSLDTPEATFTPYPTLPAVNRPSDPKVQFATPVTGTAFVPVPIDPLTGLPPSDPSLLERRPLAIKVANYPRYIRPQSGLSLADVVYEYYIEGLLTRFIAVFLGNNAQSVGPVRSGRYFDEHVARMYHAFYVFKYADPREYTYFKSGDLGNYLVVPGFGQCPPFFNGKRPIEDYNNVYFDMTKWADCVIQRGQDNSPQTLRSGFFSESIPAGGMVVTRIYTRYSADDYNYWDYDPSSGRYLRYQETNDTRDGKPEIYAPLMDGLTGKQVSADNVIVLFVSNTFASENEQQDEVYHINLIDSGKGYVFRNGLAYPARWFRTDIDQPLFISDPSGEPIYLKSGQTFFQVIGETSMDWSEGAAWHFEFQTP